MMWNTHCCKPLKFKLPEQLYKLPEINILTDSPLESLQLTEEEVRKVIKNLDTTKANGPDGISNTNAQKYSSFY